MPSPMSDTGSYSMAKANHNLSDQPAACHWRQGRSVTIFLPNHELVGPQSGSG